MENLIDDNSDKYKGKYRIPSTRLQMWDYSSDGWYFVTICVDNHQCFFGKIEDAKMVLNNVGKLVEKYWLEIPNHFNNVKLDYFVVMPNHVHGIIVIEKENVDKNKTTNNEPQEINTRCVENNLTTMNAPVETRFIASKKCPTNTKDAMNRVSTNHARKNKGGVTGKHNPMFYESISRIVRWYKGRCAFEINKLSNESLFVWQHRFYDKIIRNEVALEKIRKYIYENPLRWDIDRNNPDNMDGWVNKISKQK